eukprot:COSAG05_NODE_89_length_20177_cov_197.003586_13_plen_91_part_00
MKDEQAGWNAHEQARRGARTLAEHWRVGHNRHAGKQTKHWPLSPGNLELPLATMMATLTCALVDHHLGSRVGLNGAHLRGNSLFCLQEYR